MLRQHGWAGAIVAISIALAACSSGGADPVGTAPSTLRLDSRAGELSDDALVTETSVVASTAPATTADGVFSDDADRELSVVLLLSNFGFGQRVSAPIGVGAGKADQAVAQVGLPFNPKDGDFRSLFIISANGDLAEDPVVLTESFVELLDADIDVLIGPTLGGDVGELTTFAAEAGVPFAATGYVNDGSLSTQGVRFDIAGSLETQLDLVVRQVVEREFDSIVVVGSEDDDLGNRVDDLLNRSGASAAVASMPGEGDLDDVRQLARDVAARGDRVAVLMMTETNAVEFIDAVIAEPGGRRAVFFGADFSVSRATVSSLDAIGDGQVVVVSRANDGSRPEQVDFLARVQENNPELVRPFNAADAFDMYVLAALATAEAGGATPAVVRERIVELSRDGERCDDPASCFALLAEGVDIDYDGVSGPIEFDDDGVSTATWFAIENANPTNGELVTSEFVLHSL